MTLTDFYGFRPHRNPRPNDVEVEPQAGRAFYRMDTRPWDSEPGTYAVSVKLTGMAEFADGPKHEPFISLRGAYVDQRVENATRAGLDVMEIGIQKNGLVDDEGDPSRIAVLQLVVAKMQIFDWSRSIEVTGYMGVPEWVDWRNIPNEPFYFPPSAYVDMGDFEARRFTAPTAGLLVQVKLIAEEAMNDDWSYK